jgi:5'-phosphate synthase pdxT subunit
MVGDVRDGSKGTGAPLVGVLALQGDFAEHEQALQRQGLRTRQVRRAADLDGLDALVLPGGESTTMLKLLDVEELFEPLGRALRSGIPVLATCAGLILLAEQVENPQQRSYGVLPITVVRNGYGRQYHSGTFALAVDGSLRANARDGLTATFIRAPRITRVGDGCTVLARRDGDPVLVQRGNVLGACFHPELEHDHPVTLHFAAMVRAATPAVARG